MHKIVYVDLSMVFSDKTHAFLSKLSSVNIACFLTPDWENKHKTKITIRCFVTGSK